MIDINREPPKRLKVLIQLTDLLAGISTAEGDAFTLGPERVFRNRSLLGTDTGVTQRATLAIIEAPRPDFAVFAGEENGNRKDMWTLMIQGIVPDDQTANTFDDPYFLCQDVERRLQRIMAVKRSSTPEYPEWYLLGGMITGIDIAPPVVRPPEAQVSSNAFFYLPIRLGIAVKIGE